MWHSPLKTTPNQARLSHRWLILILVRRMRALTIAFAILGFAGCVARQAAESRTFEAAPSPIDYHRDVSIEEYILALPPYSFHEESVHDFAARVRSARMLPQNKGKSRNYLYCPGD